MSGQEHDEFKELLSQTKAKLGSNVKKLAEEFVIRSHLACERRDTGKGSI